MNEKEKKSYLDNYKKQKEKGYPFFPDILFKDAVVSLVIFLVLIALSYFLGTPLEERANPSDSSYTPRPEWYFLFLFQLLKYFPGELEVIGVVVVPTLVVLLLFALPFLDRGALRHYMNRRWVTIGTIVGMLAILVLTVLSVLEAPPPTLVAEGDPVATLYAQNCAGCHGPAMNIRESTNLHETIAQGSHEGMPSWSADLSSDQIDALVGFILSPDGNTLFVENCGECHDAAGLVGDNPLLVQDAIQQGPNFEAHADQDVPYWSGILTSEQVTALLNFLVAPDGQRLFVVNCSSCHGSSVSTGESLEELRETISEGGLHLEMPAWSGRLSSDEITSLANYVLDPSGNPEVGTLYQTNCTACHPGAVPGGEDFDQIVEIIETGGSHEDMPVWGDLLTDEQLEALAQFTFDASRGSSTSVGQELFSANCASCHGPFGEGGPNPARSGDIIAPISTAEYLRTRDDITLRNIISQGQPNFGMSPFGITNGGPLDEAELDALVSFIRSWEADPPVELPPEVSTSSVALNGGELFSALCAQCHGVSADGGIAPSLRSSSFRRGNTSEEMFTVIELGHDATAMIAWGEVLSSEQIQDLVIFIQSLPESDESSGAPSFAVAIQPIIDSRCLVCHFGSDGDGGWDGSSYQTIIESGNNGPAVIPGDVENSVLAQKITGTQTFGVVMPPINPLGDDVVQLILDWIAAGAPDN